MCILEDYRLCHFHNKEFDKIIASIQDQQNPKSPITVVSRNTSNPQGVVHHKTRFVDSLLMDKNMSCVSQLLYEGITPFPYKVAKALDPYIYRNIEFDVWNEIRKENKLKYAKRRLLLVGDKCYVRLRNNQNTGAGNESTTYVGHIQYIERYTGMYHVYIEELGQQMVVPLHALQCEIPDLKHSWWVNRPRSVSRGPYPNRYRSRRFSDGDGKMHRKKEYSKDLPSDESAAVMAHNLFDDHLKEMMGDQIWVDQGKVLYHPYIDHYAKYLPANFGFTNEFLAMPAFVKTQTPGKDEGGDSAGTPKKDNDENGKNADGQDEENLAKINEDYVFNAYCDPGYNPYNPQYYGNPFYSGCGMEPTAATSGTAAYYPYFRNGTYYYNYVYNPSPPYMVPAVGNNQGFVPQFQQGAALAQPIPVQNIVRRRDLLMSESKLNLNLQPSQAVKGADLPCKWNVSFLITTLPKIIFKLIS